MHVFITMFLFFLFTGNSSMKGATSGGGLGGEVGTAPTLDCR